MSKRNRNKKTRAIIIPWHRYHPRTSEFYRVQFDFFLETLKIIRSEFDKLYLIDDGWDFTDKDKERLSELAIEYQIIPKTREGHHWVQFDSALKYLDEEDNVLFLDNDVVIYKKGVVDGWFKAAEKGQKLVTAFDGSGGMQPIIHLKFPPLRAMGATRMGSYYFVANREVREIMKEVELGPVHYKPGTHIDELEYITVEGDWSDSFGLLTIKVFGKGMRVGLIGDPRDSIYYEKVAGEEVFNRVPMQLLDVGYYHVRNGNLANYLISTFNEEDKKDYKHCIEITPQREWLRILAWYDYMNRRVGDPLRKEIDALLADNNVGRWEDYMRHFMSYHNQEAIK